jgi:hypothetical protein
MEVWGMRHRSTMPANCRMFQRTFWTTDLPSPRGWTSAAISP